MTKASYLDSFMKNNHFPLFHLIWSKLDDDLQVQGKIIFSQMKKPKMSEMPFEESHTGNSWNSFTLYGNDVSSFV